MEIRYQLKINPVKQGNISKTYLIIKDTLWDNGRFHTEIYDYASTFDEAQAKTEKLNSNTE